MIIVRINEQRCRGRAGLAAVERFDLGLQGPRGASRAGGRLRETRRPYQVHLRQTPGSRSRSARSGSASPGSLSMECVAVCTGCTPPCAPEDTAGESAIPTKLRRDRDHQSQHRQKNLRRRRHSPSRQTRRSLDDRGQRESSKPCIIKVRTARFSLRNDHVSQKHPPARRSFGAYSASSTPSSYARASISSRSSRRRKTGYADMTGGRSSTLTPRRLRHGASEDKVALRPCSGGAIKAHRPHRQKLISRYQRSQPPLSAISTERDRILESRQRRHCIKYADLAATRMKELRLLLRSHGLSNPTTGHILYAFARIKSILRKTQAEKPDRRTDPNALAVHKGTRHMDSAAGKNAGAHDLALSGRFFKSMAEACEPSTLLRLPLRPRRQPAVSSRRHPSSACDNEQTMLSRLRPAPAASFTTTPHDVCRTRRTDVTVSCLPINGPRNRHPRRRRFRLRLVCRVFARPLNPDSRDSRLSAAPGSPASKGLSPWHSKQAAHLGGWVSRRHDSATRCSRINPLRLRHLKPRLPHGATISHHTQLVRVEG